MRFKHGLSRTLAACLIMFFMLQTQAQSNAITVIEVFSEHPLDHTYRIPNTHIEFHNFDQPNQAEKLLPVFSNNPDVAEKQFQQWKDSANGKSTMEKMKASYEPYLKAANYGITKIPAIVFDNGKYVIYGTLNVDQAVRDYDHYLRTVGKSQ
jgi:integrating conjugative element protein (TIGR03757 family)